MRIRATRGTVWTGAVVFGLVLCGSLYIAVLAWLEHQYAPSLLFGAACLLWLAFIYAAFNASLYADESFVGRTAPWPKRCRRDQLREIRYGGPFTAPGWEFVDNRGRVAFGVARLLFEDQAVERLAIYLGVPFRGVSNTQSNT